MLSVFNRIREVSISLPFEIFKFSRLFLICFFFAPLKKTDIGLECILQQNFRSWLIISVGTEVIKNAYAIQIKIVQRAKFWLDYARYMQMRINKNQMLRKLSGNIRLEN